MSARREHRLRNLERRVAELETIAAMSIRTLYWSGRRSMSISKPRLPGIERCLLEWRLMA